MSFVGPIIGQGLKTAGRYIYQGLRQQERIIDYTYRKTGLYNRGVVRGIKHGLAGGQISGGSLSLGLNTDEDEIESNGISQPHKLPSSRKYSETRRRRTKRRNYCYSRPRTTNFRRR